MAEGEELESNILYRRQSYASERERMAEGEEQNSRFCITLKNGYRKFKDGGGGWQFNKIRPSVTNSSSFGTSRSKASRSNLSRSFCDQSL